MEAALLKFPLTIKYIKGVNNGAADYLSRNALLEIAEIPTVEESGITQDRVVKDMHIFGLAQDEVAAFTINDTSLKFIRDYLNHNILPKSRSQRKFILAYVNCLSQKDSILLLTTEHHNEAVTLVVLPEQLR